MNACKSACGLGGPGGAGPGGAGPGGAGGAGGTSAGNGGSGPGGTNQGGTSQGGTNQGGTNQGGTNQGGTNQGGTGNTGSAGTPGQCSLTMQGSQGEYPVCCTPTADEKARVDEVLNLLNNYRMTQGRSALAHDPKLELAMQGHCRHMVERNFFDHKAPEGPVRNFYDRSQLCGASSDGENIAAGQQSASQVMMGLDQQPRAQLEHAGESHPCGYR